MAKQRRMFDQNKGVERVQSTLDRMAAEARQVLGDPFTQVYFSVAFRREHVEELFRKAVRGLDALCELLNAASGPFSGTVELEALATCLVTADGPTLHAVGLRRGASGAWETDFLALEYALGQDPERVFGLFEAVARDHLRPLLPGPQVAAA